jgi:hypothetical protein
MKRTVVWSFLYIVVNFSKLCPIEICHTGKSILQLTIFSDHLVGWSRLESRLIQSVLVN